MKNGLRNIVVTGNISAALSAIEKVKITVSRLDTTEEKKAASLAKLQKAYDLVNEAGGGLLSEAVPEPIR